MIAPNGNDVRTTTLDIAKFHGYTAAEAGFPRHKNEYVEPNHKAKWFEGYDEHKREVIAKTKS